MKSPNWFEHIHLTIKLLSGDKLSLGSNKIRDIAAK
jgi:hypothetical protein